MSQGCQCTHPWCSGRWSREESRSLTIAAAQNTGSDIRTCSRRGGCTGPSDAAAARSSDSGRRVRWLVSMANEVPRNDAHTCQGPANVSNASQSSSRGIDGFKLSRLLPPWIRLLGTAGRVAADRRKTEAQPAQPEPESFARRAVRVGREGPPRRFRPIRVSSCGFCC